MKNILITLKDYDGKEYFFKDLYKIKRLKSTKAYKQAINELETDKEIKGIRFYNVDVDQQFSKVYNLNGIITGKYKA